MAGCVRLARPRQASAARPGNCGARSEAMRKPGSRRHATRSAWLTLEHCGPTCGRSPPRSPVGEYTAHWPSRTAPLLRGIDDEWALIERHAFEDRLAGALSALTLGALERGDIAGAVRWARRRTRLAPRDEPAARALMVALAVEGERAAALEVYRALSSRLCRELGVAPAPATLELARRIRAGDSAAAMGRPLRALLPWIQRDSALIATDAPRARD